jgi:hypothetical protein
LISGNGVEVNSEAPAGEGDDVPINSIPPGAENAGGNAKSAKATFTETFDTA